MWVMRGRRGVSGSVIMSHALLAGKHTIEECYHMHSLHCNYIASSGNEASIQYHVERIKEGRLSHHVLLGAKRAKGS
jgi:acyl-CoA thioesterase II